MFKNQDYSFISTRNIVYYNNLLTLEQYETLSPVERYYQLNTHIIRNILDQEP